jgi:glycosyltransferase involved in cell wall biosynthesis
MALIGVLTTSYPRWEGDAAGVFVRGFARALVARGHRIDVLAPSPRAPSRVHDDGITLHHVPYAPPALARTFYGAGVPDNVRRDPLAWLGLATYPAALYREARARVARWDAIVSHWALPCALIAAAVREERPHLAVLHSADVHLLRRLPLRARWARAIVEGSTQLVFSSHDLRREFVSYCGRAIDRAHVSAMGIDEPGDRPLREHARRANGARGFVALSLSRLVPIKGIDVAMEALRGAAESELWIAGDGPLRRELEASGGARFFGHVSGHRKAELLAAADVFVAPSLRLASGRTEGVPTAILEAAASGLPIVASAVGGIPDVFEDGVSALLVEPGDPRALRDAIARVRRDRDLHRNLAHSARAIGRRYYWSTLAPRFEALALG